MSYYLVSYHGNCAIESLGDRNEVERKLDFRNRAFLDDHDGHLRLPFSVAVRIIILDIES